MVSILAHLIIFFQISLVALILSICGFLLKKVFLNYHDQDNFEENGLFGFILVGFIALLINFFVPLNYFVNNITSILLIYFGFKLNFFSKNYLKLLKKLLIVSIFSYTLIIYSNVNTPDAFLYHLPYSKILNDDKIIFGLSNLHSRFGHISIFQYISSFFVNNLFSTNGLLIPISLVQSFFFIFCFKQFRRSFKSISLRINSYIYFLILIITLYSFSRYSGLGNDAQVHTFYFLSTIYFLKNMNEKNNLNIFYKLSIVSLFTFFIKPFYLISLLMPLTLFATVKNKAKILKSKIFIFSTFFLFLWLLKNLIVSSCLIYPVNATCIKNTSWYNFNTPEIAKQGEVWSKDWSNNLDNSLTVKEYLNDFNWFKTWYKNHLRVIFEKILPVIIFIIINIIIIFFSKCLGKNDYAPDNKFYFLLLLINLLGFLIWFFKFPIFRYGQSYIYSVIIFASYFVYIRNFDLYKIGKLYNFFIIFILIGFVGFFIKNINRINKTDNKEIYPKIYDKNYDGEVVRVYNKNGIFIHYKNPKGLCGYSLSPCSFINIDIPKDQKLGYTIFKPN